MGKANAAMILMKAGIIQLLGLLWTGKEARNATRQGLLPVQF